jgi:hypothetical protein
VVFNLRAEIALENFTRLLGHLTFKTLKAMFHSGGSATIVMRDDGQWWPNTRPAGGA